MLSISSLTASKRRRERRKLHDRREKSLSVKQTLPRISTEVATEIDSGIEFTKAEKAPSGSSRNLEADTGLTMSAADKPSKRAGLSSPADAGIMIVDGRAAAA
jgi:hypothetical protein